ITSAGSSRALPRPATKTEAPKSPASPCQLRPGNYPQPNQSLGPPRDICSKQPSVRPATKTLSLSFSLSLSLSLFVPLSLSFSLSHLHSCFLSLSLSLQ